MMVRSKFGLKAIGLCALMLGLMAAAGSSLAQAETGAQWGYMDGATLKILAAPLEPSVGGTLENNHATLLSEALKGKFDVLCTSFTPENTKLIPGGKAKGLLTFHGCKILFKGVVQGSCEPNAEGTHPGLIKTLELKGLIVLHTLGDGTKHQLVEFTPETGTAFAHIETGKLCSFGENILVGGKFFIKDCGVVNGLNAFTHHLKEHLIEEFLPLTKLWIFNDTPEHKAEIDGSAKVFLTGAHVNFLWAGLAI